jgi:hypothetical protein
MVGNSSIIGLRESLPISSPELSINLANCYGIWGELARRFFAIQSA